MFATYSVWEVRGDTSGKDIVCNLLSFYAWGFIDESFRHWAMIGGYTTFIAFIVNARKRKGQALVDFSLLLMIACAILLLCLRIADYIRG